MAIVTTRLPPIIPLSSNGRTSGLGPDDVGSNPTRGTFYSSVAEQVQQLTVNQEITRSSRVTRANFMLRSSTGRIRDFHSRRHGFESRTQYHLKRSKKARSDSARGDPRLSLEARYSLLLFI